MIRAFQWDLARQVERLDWLLAQLPRYAEWGYNELYLHLEDAVEFPRLPAVARADAYSYREMERLVAAATHVGIKVVPIVNLLGHTQYLIKVPALRELNELCDADGQPLERGQICPLHPRTLEIAEKLLRDVAPFCTAGKVHVGLDESFHLGKHPRSRREIARIGRDAHFARYVGRLRNVTRSLDLRMGMWGDMLYFLPGAISLLPRDVAVYEWYYYKFGRRPRVELFNFAETDLGELLRARGIEYWGCPMNGAFRHEPMPHFTDRLENALSWWRRCGRLDAAGLLVTSWEPNRLAVELTTVVDAAIASLWLDNDATEPRAMLERGFIRVFGRTGAKAATQAALASDRYPFSGYPRWETNERWDVISRREPAVPYRVEEKCFRALVKRGRAARSRIPEPLQASVELRWYLAQRDVWLRDPARGLELIPAMWTGWRAARLMWTRTRHKHTSGPNEAIILADRQRLFGWKAGRPVFGPKWQLCYRVHNFAPAAQLVAVEQQRPDGIWETRQSCHTIEFQSRAARPRSGVVREHAAPIDWNGDQTQFPQLRLVVRGIGQVRIEDAVLTDQTDSWPVRPQRKKLGRTAPRAGWPEVDGTPHESIWPLRFVARDQKPRTNGREVAKRTTRSAPTELRPNRSDRRLGPL
jgi:hypothetical protein